LRSRYPGLTVLTGAEVEYVDILNMLERWLQDLDFVLEGVHLLDMLALDWSEEEFLKGRIFGGYPGCLRWSEFCRQINREPHSKLSILLST
jgi:histidinol phosphatase-like PHP family hydrolase